jgi:hypothetical protein
MHLCAEDDGLRLPVLLSSLLSVQILLLMVRSVTSLNHDLLSFQGSTNRVAMRECEYRGIVAGTVADVFAQSICAVHVCFHVCWAAQCVVSSSPAGY